MIFKALYFPHCVLFCLPITLQVAAAIIIISVIITISVLLVGAPRAREVGQLALGHVDRKWQSQLCFLPTHQTIRDDPISTVHCWY